MKNNQKQINFDYELGYCEFDLQLRGKRYLIQGSPVVANLLYLICEKENAKFGEIRSILKVSAENLQNYLGQLLGEGLVKVQDESYVFNYGFESGEEEIFIAPDYRKEVSQKIKIKKKKSKRNNALESNVVYLLKSQNSMSIGQV